MKIATFIDPHISDVNPSTRKDDYKEAIFKKLSFIRDYCNREHVDVVVCGGDTFHRKSSNLNSHDTVRRLIELFSSFNMPIYSAVGNHDISGSAKNLDKQPISVIEQAGALTLLGFPYTKQYSADFKDACIYGLCYSDQCEKFSEPYIQLAEQIEDASKCNILLMHQALFPDGQTFFGDYLNFNELAQLDFDVVICGHIHAPFPNVVEQKYGKLFINPGSIARGSLDSCNIDRQPQFVILDIKSKTDISWEVIKIPCESTEDVFDMMKVKRSIVAKEDISKFTSTLKSVVEDSVDITSTDGLIQLLSTVTDDVEVISFCKQYIEKAQESL